MPGAPRRHLLVSFLLVVSLGFGGCLTLDPTVTADTSDSTVFESVSTEEPWVSGRVRTSVTLASNATSAQGVTQLTVTDESGDTFDSISVSSGQTSGLTLYLPANQNATITAVNSINGTTVETLTVRTGGDNVF